MERKQSISSNIRRGNCDIKNTNFVEKNFKETEILHFETLKNKIGKIEFKLNSVEFFYVSKKAPYITKKIFVVLTYR